MLTFFFGFLFGMLIGWVRAHHTVATECRRLGKFYVGDKTYHCTVIDDKDEFTRENRG